MENTIFCFLHWNGENIRTNDGSIVYKGGITDAIYARDGMTFEEFKSLVFSRLNIDDHEDKFLHFTAKYDPNQLVPLKDDIGVHTLIHCNDEYANVYVSRSEYGVVSSANDDRSNNETLSTHSSSHNDVSRLETSTNEHLQLGIGERWKYCITGVGQVFENADSIRDALYKFSIAHRFSYKITHNKPQFVKVKCIAENCKWGMTASQDGNTGNLSIRKMHGEHTHSIEDVVSFKPKFRARLMGIVVVDKLIKSPAYLPRQIGKDVMDEYKVSLTYKQAWKSKEEASQMLDGKAEDSYKLIPWYCDRLKEVMPDTVAEWSNHDDGTFKQLFLSYGCSIHGFHDGCRPIVFIDGCHITGPYKGTLLAASALDAGNGMYPLAYGVVTYECEEDWLWFLQHLKNVVRNKEIVIVSDRNPAILNSVNALFGSVNHAYCYRHLQENFSKFINRNPFFKLNSESKKRAHSILNEVAYARRMDRYENAMAKLYNFQPKLHEWVLQNHPENLSNALFPRQRWDWLNSNLAESFNAWMGEARNYPIAKLMQAHVEKYAQLLLNKVHDLSSWKNGFGKRIEDKMSENVIEAQYFSAKSRPPFEFEVYGCRKGAVVVNFSNHTCSCMEWQMTGIPCPHACCAAQMQSCSIYECVSDCYRRVVQERIFAKLMPGIPTFDMPSPSNIPTVTPQEDTFSPGALLTPKTKRAPGRPKKKRIESQFLGRRSIQCSRCKGTGHNRSTCKEPVG